ncbi:endonuclease G [Sulfurivirga caldicuralii]|uniref:Endonuclease G n=1 Tax=Sulfurivirga caldicuralii TaxID=364032 RepID=A0A1N6DBW9_9GAMM|nr:DNA/RNA non-specific endonuclease [Sulfurivirga caldicuralii]SIN68176.1 endonuclease G [Sulfurivirga caldicuralii]
MRRRGNTRAQRRLLRGLVGWLLGSRRRMLGALLLATVGGSGWYAHEVYVARPQMAWMGVPQETRRDLSHLTAHVLRNPGFMLSYSEWKGSPLWVTYKLFRPEKPHPVGKRPPFRPDWRTLRHVTSDDYTGSGYDRGHMAPNYAIALLYGRRAQEATFLMSNIAPQCHRLNSKWWQRLESAAIDHFTRHFREIWVVTGPVWDEKPRYLKRAWIDIPDAFYKIFVGIDIAGRPHALAFMVPQTVRGFEPLSKYLTTIDAIEARTGLDFFWRLPDAQEARLEREAATGAFHLRAVDRLPSRY